MVCVPHPPRASPRRRAWWILAAGLILVSLAVTAWLLGVRVPQPDGDTVAGWGEQARGLGAGLPLVFLALHVVVTVTPVPRTAFSLAAGILFGSAEGLALTLLATTVSAVLALLLTRHVGRSAVAARLRHRSARAVDTHLARRGWVAVLSLRLIPVVPFWLINYCAGVSAVRVVPFAAATLVGALPGTAAIVLLGDAVGGSGSPLLLLVSLSCAAVGALVLVLDGRSALRVPVPLEPAGKV